MLLKGCRHAYASIFLTSLLEAFCMRDAGKLFMNLTTDAVVPKACCEVLVAALKWKLDDVAKTTKIKMKPGSDVG